MALTTIEPTPATNSQPSLTAGTPAQPTHYKPKPGQPTLRTKSLPASGAQFPFQAPPSSNGALTTPIGDPWPRPYYQDSNLRRVEPYHFTYNTYCKARWRNRPVLEIFASEFRDRPLEYYRDAILAGRITLNGEKIASLEQRVKNGDVISHTLHRHEPPVTADAIGIVHEDDEMLVINKPAGVPVHPAGRYNFNSLNEILRAQRGYHFQPMPCNRLDRLTSGIMFMGKTRAATERLGSEIRSREVRKEYVARVVGEFPEDEVVCEKPILQISPKLGLNAVRATGKEARTVFRRLAFYPSRDGDRGGGEIGVEDGERSEEGMPWKRKRGYSIVRCFPITGRTHQLRVHLQFLGHPITNDPIYCNQRVFGHDLGVNRATDSDDGTILDALSKMGKSEAADAVAYHDEMVDEYNKRKAEKQNGEMCGVCGTALYSDPGVHELGIYLHALRYAQTDGKWDYRTELPKWALPPEGVEGPTEPTLETDPLTSNVANVTLADDEHVEVKREAVAQAG